MSTSGLADLLTRCGCCRGIGDTPTGSVENPYGLSALRYRAGTHGSFKEAMLTAIASQPTLRVLGTRHDDDLTIGAIDAWAVVLDVLTFYQERIANEVFLRTAQERLSLLELARLIGYELRPGVAANVLLAFTLDTSDTSPVDVTIPEGLRTQSIPVDDSPPQSFEVSEEFLARPHWNELRPRKTRDHELVGADKKALGTYYLNGVGAGLRVGDPLLLVADDQVTDDGIGCKLLRVTEVETEADQDRTRVVVGPGGGPSASFAPHGGSLYELLTGSSVGMVAKDLAGAGATGQYVSVKQVESWYAQTATTYADLQNALLAQKLAATEVVPLDTSPNEPDIAEPGLYVLHRTASPFGHNAPLHATILEQWRKNPDDPFAKNWDDPEAPVDILSDSQETTTRGNSTVYLDQVYTDIVAGGLAVFRRPRVSDEDSLQVYRVKAVGERSIADFALSGSGTVLELSKLESGAEVDDLKNFKFRTTTIHAASELLELAEIPIKDLTHDTGDDTNDETNDADEKWIIELEEFVTDLLPGRRLVLVGTRRGDYEGVVGAEEIELKDVEIAERTRLILAEPLQYSYDNSTVRIYANVVEATHGETREETLGSGDASRPMQRFKLSKAPLTHVPAATPSGAESTLELKVDGVTWDEASSLYTLGLKDRSYVVRQDDGGNSFAIFGDGRRGERLPTGAENVTARYRWGIGSDGMVDADAIKLLPIKPLGVKQVTNPIASAGGEDPEERENARENAPLTVLTLDRVVSLKDFEDLSRTFAGIGKARAEWIWHGGRQLVHVTVAGPDGSPLSPTNVDNLIDALETYSRPHVPLVVSDCEKLQFELTAGVRVDPDYVIEEVFEAVEEALEAAFSFESRRFAQRVSKSEVQAVIQGVDGVDWLDLDSLDYVKLHDDENMPDPYGLPAKGARVDPGDGSLCGAQLLLLSPVGITLEERK